MARDSWTDERLDDLNTKVDRGFVQVDQRFDRFQGDVDRRFDEVNKRFDEVNERFVRFEASVDRRFENVERQLEGVNERFDAMLDRFAQLTYVLMGSMGVIFAALLGVFATQL
ncbi:MAG TPA: hypothetical protein VF731_06265 [Solirubrobacterales bacterium]